MKSLFFILLFVLSLPVFAASTTDNEFIIGSKTGTDAKYLIFRDANKTRFTIDHATGDLSWGGNNFTLGNGVAGDKKIIVDTGDGANNPKLVWSNAKQKWRQEVAGADKDIGSGSGSGGGENYNNALTSDDNPNAEDGTTAWTSSGGTFVLHYSIQA